MAAAERALSRAFVQFRNVEPISRILQKRERDVINPDDDVIDFSSDESQRTAVVTMFTDFAVSSAASLATSSSSSTTEAATTAAAENDVSRETVMTSSG